MTFRDLFHPQGRATDHPLAGPLRVCSSPAEAVVAALGSVRSHCGDCTQSWPGHVIPQHDCRRPGRPRPEEMKQARAEGARSRPPGGKESRRKSSVRILRTSADGARASAYLHRRQGAAATRARRGPVSTTRNCRPAVRGVGRGQGRSTEVTTTPCDLAADLRRLAHPPGTAGRELADWLHRQHRARRQEGAQDRRQGGGCTPSTSGGPRDADGADVDARRTPCERTRGPGT